MDMRAQRHAWRTRIVRAVVCCGAAFTLLGCGGDSPVPVTSPSPLPVRLRMNEAGQFRIMIWTDLHFGEAPDSWGPRIDNLTCRLFEHLLQAEANLSLVVLNGDTLTGLNIDNINHRSLDYWRRIVSYPQAAAVPHTATLGNHDHEHYSGRLDSDPHVPTRQQFMEFDMSLEGSFSKLGPQELLPCGASVYTVDVYPAHPAQEETPVLRLIHLDSGGMTWKGSAPEPCPQVVAERQVDWLNAHLEEAPQLPALVFVHIPAPEYGPSWTEGQSTSKCVGVRNDGGVATTTENTGVFAALAARDNVLGIFAGHNHGNDFCCDLRRSYPNAASGALRAARKLSEGNATLPLCYGRHSSFGGYSSDPRLLKGARVIEVHHRDGQMPRVESYIRSVDNSTRSSLWDPDSASSFAELQQVLNE